jgi:hypothetical protein
MHNARLKISGQADQKKILDAPRRCTLPVRGFTSGYRLLPAPVPSSPLLKPRVRGTNQYRIGAALTFIR